MKNKGCLFQIVLIVLLALFGVLVAHLVHGVQLTSCEVPSEMLVNPQSCVNTLQKAYPLYLLGGAFFGGWAGFVFSLIGRFFLGRGFS